MGIFVREKAGPLMTHLALAVFERRLQDGTVNCGSSFTRPELLDTVLNDSLTGLTYFTKKSQLNLPPLTDWHFGTRIVDRIAGH